MRSLQASLIFLTFSLLFPYQATANNQSVDSFTTGKDWQNNMSDGEKLIALVAPTMLFQNYHVPMQKSLLEYITTINRILLYNPYLEKEEVANIFASAVYAYEPQSRPALENLERILRRRKASLNEDFFPPLTLRPIASRPTE